VKVRLLLDARMHATYPRPADSLGRLPGFEVRVVDFGRIAGGVQHAKAFVVDGRVAFVGSQNLDWRALAHIHELGALVHDDRVASVFADVFELDWAAADTSGRPFGRDTVAALRARLGAAGHPPLPIPVVLGRGDTAHVVPVASPRGFLPDSSLWDLPRLVAMIDGARDEVLLQVLQYGHGRSERLALDDALRRAAARGVRIRMVVSDWVMGTRNVETLRSLDSLAAVRVRLSTLPEWSGGYIPFARVEHCKYLVVDRRRLWIGTSNWEPGYFTGSRNLGIVIESRTLARQASRIFEISWRAPSASPIRHGVDYPAKVRGETPPPGRRVHGGSRRAGWGRWRVAWRRKRSAVQGVVPSLCPKPGCRGRGGGWIAARVAAGVIAPASRLLPPEPARRSTPDRAAARPPRRRAATRAPASPSCPTGGRAGSCAPRARGRVRPGAG
jgi:phosphatidylserine/phosphatidylglycerophosphate/cardiolipin synthase-like enzyme